MKPRTHTLLLSFCAILLALVGILSVSTQVRFDGEVTRRSTEINDHLRKILEAEDKYCETHGRYTSNWGDLIGGGYLADSLCVIPYSEGDLFSLTCTTEKDPSGQNIQTVDCSAEYTQFLADLSPHLVGTLIDESADTGGFPGLSISRTTLLTDK